MTRSFDTGGKESSSGCAIPEGLGCLLCGGKEFKAIWRLTGADVRALWRAMGRNLSEKAFGLLTSEGEVTQFECSACGFRFFDPALAGGEEFYAELEKGDYYVPHRPEFDFALRLARKNHAHSVLDVGAGEGGFLERARAAGLATFALELNRQAAEICAGKGHHTLPKLLHEVSPSELDGGVDVLTLFQVVEHVANPRKFLRQAVPLVKRGGLLVVAVPNDRGVYRLFPFDPAGMPPHHVSRWRSCDLEQLGRECGLMTVARGADILYGAGLERFWLEHNRLAAVIDRAPHPGGAWLPKTLSFVYRKLGCRHYCPRRGLSIYAAYRKP